MSRDFERWRSPAGLGTNSFSLCLAHCADGTQPAGLVRHCHAFHGNDAFYKSATVDFRNASSMRVLRGGDKRSPRGIRSPHPWRSCPLGQVLSLLSYASFSRLGEMPSLISSLPPPARGRGLLSFLPSEGKGLASRQTTPCRAGRPGQSLPEGLPRASFLDAFQEMVKGKGMPP
jgi:hypothetical protein